MSKESNANVNAWLETWKKKIHGNVRGESAEYKKAYYNEHKELLAKRNPRYSLNSPEKGSEPAAAPASRANSGPLTREQAIEIALHPGAFFRKMKSNSARAKMANSIRRGGRRTRHTKRRHTRKN
jgi:hypothetical protein